MALNPVLQAMIKQGAKKYTYDYIRGFIDAACDGGGQFQLEISGSEVVVIKGIFDEDIEAFRKLEVFPLEIGGDNELVIFFLTEYAQKMNAIC